MDMSSLTIGAKYTRPELAERWGYESHHALGRGVVTPQGEKIIRAGDHQAEQAMYVVRVTDGKFKIVSQVSGPDAIGADTCTRF